MSIKLTTELHLEYLNFEFRTHQEKVKFNRKRQKLLIFIESNKTKSLKKLSMRCQITDKDNI